MRAARALAVLPFDYQWSGVLVPLIWLSLPDTIGLLSEDFGELGLPLEHLLAFSQRMRAARVNLPEDVLRWCTEQRAAIAPHVRDQSSTDTILARVRSYGYLHASIQELAMEAFDPTLSLQSDFLA